jgi:hypothetical protein
MNQFVEIVTTFIAAHIYFVIIPMLFLMLNLYVIAISPQWLLVILYVVLPLYALNKWIDGLPD